MEICGTHTFAIAKFGIKSIYGRNVDFLSGPGCPVCVTSQADIDYIIELAGNKKNIIASFGDMMRVPSGNLEVSLAKLPGDNIRIIYSPKDALAAALDNPDKNVILISVGFETTAPLIASVVLEAKEKKIGNFYIFSVLKTIIPAIDALLESKQINADGFILPGHVCSVTGSKPFEFIYKKYNIPCVVAGFSHNNLKEAVDKLLDMRATGKYGVSNCYKSVVSLNGNKTASGAVKKVFETEDVFWRGLGNIKNSGLKLKDKYSDFDVLNKYKRTAPKKEDKNSCICGKLFTGKYKPSQCKNFAVKCTPATPVGPCMVSSEGVCASYYKYGDGNEK